MGNRGIRQSNSKLDRPQPPRYRKRVLAVQAMVGETAWLDGVLLWQEDRVVWQTERGPRAPQPADLALAGRRLGQIARYRIAAMHALGNPAAWLAGRQARITLAKWLLPLRAADLPGLATRAATGDAAAVRTLVPLLAAEALCLNGLPTLPSAALLAGGAPARPVLTALIEDSTAPLDGRALAALVLGALARRLAEPDTLPAPPAVVRTTGWLHRAYRWGRQAGLPADPALIVTLLADAEGTALAKRYTAVAAAPGPFALPSAQPLRELLAQGIPAAQVVRLVEALGAAGSVEARLRRLPLPQPDPRSKPRRNTATLIQERKADIAALRTILHEYAYATGDPAAITQVTQLVHDLLERGMLKPRRSEVLFGRLRGGLTLPPALRTAYTELLVAALTAAHSLDAWRSGYQDEGNDALLNLLRTTGDVSIVREAMRLDVLIELGHRHWRDPEMYRWLLATIRATDSGERPHEIWPLCRVLDQFKEATGARAVLGPLLEAILAGPVGPRRMFLHAVCDELPHTHQGLADAVPRLIRYIPRLIRFAWEHGGEYWQHRTLLGGVLALDRAVPEEAERWLEWLMALLVERATQADDADERGLPLALTIPLAVTLAAGDFACFQAIVRTAQSRNFDYDWHQLEETAKVLPRVLGLRPLLAALFPQHPQRCINLLARIGLTQRLEPANLVPLAALDPAIGAEDGPPPTWHPLLALSPDLAPAVTAYCHARRLLGESPDLPVGVGRALAQPGKWAAELIYLEARCAAEPGRSALAARAANLRARLADTAGVAATVRQEAGERLAQVAAEAQLAAAEGQMRACYRARLDQVAGPLPPDLVLDDDWLNATLLVGDINNNRRLLLRLLRARLAGNQDWPEQHPANQAFLAGLAARGVDRTAWLGTGPRLYRCAGVAGGHVRLHLERDPLRILQMGNYFDTCLSFGGGNAFSTVANACELNKRVVYATDGSGRVVGRKLIGITAEGALIGFRTYSALRDKAGNAALRVRFRRYLTEFAARCGLPLADDGTVPRLFAAAWYDDGAVPWQEEESATSTAPSGAPAPPSPRVPTHA